MGSRFQCTAIFNYKNEIRINDCLQAMGHYQSGASLSQIIECLLNFSFRFRIKRSCRLIQQKNGRIF